MSLNPEKLIIGNFAHFVEKGTVVGENTVDSGFYPEESEDLSAWNELGCVLQAVPEPTINTTTDKCPSPAGGYIDEDTNNVTKDVLKISLKCYSEPIWRMVWGLAAPIVNGTPQTPFLSKDRFVEGWLNFEQRGDDGQKRTVSVIYGRMRIDENPTWSADPSKPAIRFEVMYSSIASLEPLNIAAA